MVFTKQYFSGSTHIFQIDNNNSLFVTLYLIGALLQLARWPTRPYPWTFALPDLYK
jgi:hypothetical protein